MRALRVRERKKERKEVKMKNFPKLIVLFIVVLGLTLWGCGKESTGIDEPETDKEAIDLLVKENPSYFNTENHYGDEDTTGGSLFAFVPVKTYFWYREIEPEPPIHIDIDIVGDSAFVAWSGKFDGTLHLFSSTDTVFPPDTIIHYTKDFTDYGERYAIFKRLFPMDEDPQHRRGWRLVMVSGAEITSDPNTVQIDSVRLNSVSYPDTLFTDPLALFAKEDVVTLAPEEKCSLTVYTNSDTIADYVFLHSWRRHISHHRSRFTPLGNGVYTGVWFAPANMQGAVNVLHHSAFDLLDKETLDDTEKPYDCNAWLFPYFVSTAD